MNQKEHMDAGKQTRGFRMQCRKLRRTAYVLIARRSISYGLNKNNSKRTYQLMKDLASKEHNYPGPVCEMCD